MPTAHVYMISRVRSAVDQTLEEINKDYFSVSSCPSLGVHTENHGKY